ncbi:MAG: hypothetical protein LBN25_02425 [Christensenellaceae bacterium]|jgi:hypothetical protein|nr:hypothetical protein [Christensenellaceae bacterium]
MSNLILTNDVYGELYRLLCGIRTAVGVAVISSNTRVEADALICIEAAGLHNTAVNDAAVVIAYNASEEELSGLRYKRTILICSSVSRQSVACRADDIIAYKESAEKCRAALSAELFSALACAAKPVAAMRGYFNAYKDRILASLVSGNAAHLVSTLVFCEPLISFCSANGITDSGSLAENFNGIFSSLIVNNGDYRGSERDIKLLRRAFYRCGELEEQSAAPAAHVYA